MPWIIFGDSHVGAFRYASEQGWIAQACEFIEVGGATAVGLRNPNSLTNALQIFAQHLLPPRPECTPVMQLGEVDCGFVIWWRSERYCEDVNVQLQASIDAHLAFIDLMLLNGYGAVVITGAVLPTIRDGQDWGAVANARREVIIPLVDRTALTLRYNAMLQDGALKRKCPFIDISKNILDPRTGIIYEEYRSDDPMDHHLDKKRAGQLWANALNSVIM